MDKLIFMIRHGETDLNQENRFQGKGCDPSLNATGRKQAELFFKNYKDIPFNKIYTSTLRRSIESVDLFAKRGIPIEQCPELNEISWGVKEGMQRDSFNSHQYDELKRLWRDGQLTAKMEGGESPLEVQQRLMCFFHKLMVRENEDLVLLSMHGRAMRIFLCSITNTPLKEMDQFVHQNLGVYVVQIHDQYVNIVKFNDAHHLSGMVTSYYG